MSSGHRIGKPGPRSMAGFDGVLPDSPPTFDEIPASAYDPVARLALMDERGHRGSGAVPERRGFRRRLLPAAGRPRACRRVPQRLQRLPGRLASADPNRLIPVMATPFWDVRLRRSRDPALHRPTATGPSTSATSRRTTVSRRSPAPIGTPIWAAAQDAGVPISFHIGGGDIGGLMRDAAGMGWQVELRQGVVPDLMVDNMRCVADLIFGGVCHRFPEPEVRVGRERRRLDPRGARDLRLAVAGRRHRATSTPSTTCSRPSTSGARSTAASGSRGPPPGRPSRPTRTTSSTRPTTRTRPASTRVRAPRPNGRGTTPVRCSGRCPAICSARCCSKAPPPSTAWPERRRSTWGRGTPTGACRWSGRRESNPRSQLGKLMFCR